MTEIRGKLQPSGARARRALAHAILDASDCGDETLAVDADFLVMAPSSGAVRIDLRCLHRAVREGRP